MESSNYRGYGYKTQHSYPRSRLITWRRPEVKFGRNVVKKKQHKNYQDEDKKSVMNKKINSQIKTRFYFFSAFGLNNLTLPAYRRALVKFYLFIVSIVFFFLFVVVVFLFVYLFFLFVLFFVFLLFFKFLFLLTPLVERESSSLTMWKWLRFVFSLHTSIF